MSGAIRCKSSISLRCGWSRCGCHRREGVGEAHAVVFRVVVRLADLLQLPDDPGDGLAGMGQLPEKEVSRERVVGAVLLDGLNHERGDRGIRRKTVGKVLGRHLPHDRVRMRDRLFDRVVRQTLGQLGEHRGRVGQTSRQRRVGAVQSELLAHHPHENRPVPFGKLHLPEQPRQGQSEELDAVAMRT